MDDDPKKPPECSDGDTVTVLGPQVDGMLPCVRHEADHTVSIGYAQVLSQVSP